MGNCKCGSCEKDEALEKILEVYKRDKDNLIQILNEVQEHYGYIPKSAQMRVAEYLGLALAEVYGVVTFYSFFTMEPKGANVINVCLGTACFVRGSGKILEKLEELLQIKNGETTKDGKFTLTTLRCVGACGLAPVMQINDKTYGNITEDDVEGILANY